MMISRDIEILFENLPLLLKNKDKILNNKSYSQCKVKGTGVFFRNKQTGVCFTLGDLLKLWSIPYSSWKFGNFYTYKMILFGNGEADTFSKTADGGYQQSLIDSDLIIPLVDNAIRDAGLLLLPKCLKGIVEELKNGDKDLLKKDKYDIR